MATAHRHHVTLLALRRDRFCTTQWCAWQSPADARNYRAGLYDAVPPQDDLRRPTADALRRVEGHGSVDAEATATIDRAVLRVRAALLPRRGVDPADVHAALHGQLHPGCVLSGQDV